MLVSLDLASCSCKMSTVAYTSQALTDTDTRNYRIGLELLNVVYGQEKFHQYAFNQNMKMWSGHE